MPAGRRTWLSKSRYSFAAAPGCCHSSSANSSAIGTSRASANRWTTVTDGLRAPRSIPLTYVRSIPNCSANFSCAKPLARRSRRIFRPRRWRTSIAVASTAMSSVTPRTMSIIFHWTCRRTQATSVAMNQINPPRIHYIKLGAGGRWEGALDRGRLEWGNYDDRHVAGLAGNWAAVTQAYIANGRIQATATGYTNEARSFFNDDPATLWITFARGRLWWCQADPEVHAARSANGTDAAYYRTTLGGWRDRDLDGRALDFERLSTRLLQLQGYQRTICALKPDQEALCRRYINATPDPAQAAIAAARLELRRHLQTLVQQLTWRDFEQLIDLALARTGWVRMSSLGGTMKDVDLVVEQAFTRERMAVQIKSSANQQVVDDYARRLAARAPDERIMLICHSPASTLVVPPSTGSRRLELVQGSALADLAINAGLVDWVITRAR